MKRSRFVHPSLLALPAALLGAVLFLGIGIAQEGTPEPTRRATPVNIGGIDNGLAPAGTDVERAVKSQRSLGRPSTARATRIVVKFRAGAAGTDPRAVASSVGGRLAPRRQYADFDAITVEPADAAAVLRQLRARPDVEYAYIPSRTFPTFRPNDPLYDRQWNMTALDMERAWDINPGASSDVIVAVLDTGVAFTNAIVSYDTAGLPAVDEFPELPSLGVISVPFAAAPDLAGTGRFVSPRDFIWNDNLPVDSDGHGTHVSGTIGQRTDNAVGVAGMAFNTRIMPVKVLTSFWESDVFLPFHQGTVEDLVLGIRYAADNGANVINMSLGLVYDGPPDPVEVAQLTAALRYAVDRGVFVAIAAGNDFENGNPTAYPAAIAPQIDGVVAVGAVGRDIARATYSNTGTYVEIAAPGGDTSPARGGEAGGILQQTFDPRFIESYLALDPADYFAPRFDVFEYRFFQGTSMATPHVAGFAAMLFQQGITNPAAIEAAMKRYARDIGASGRDNLYGYGLIQPRATLRGLGLLR